MKCVLFFLVCKPTTWGDLKKGKACVLQTAQGFMNSHQAWHETQDCVHMMGPQKPQSSVNCAGLCQQHGALKKAASFANCGNPQMVLPSPHTMGLCKMHRTQQTPCWQVVKLGCHASWLAKLGLPTMGSHCRVSPRAI